MKNAYANKGLWCVGWALLSMACIRCGHTFIIGLQNPGWSQMELFLQTWPGQVSAAGGAIIGYLMIKRAAEG